MRQSVPAAALLAAAVLAACGGANAPRVVSPGDGWTQKGASSWVNAAKPAERYGVTLQQNYQGTLKDLASQLTTSTILRYKGAKFVRSVPYPDCPGEAGLQTFTLASGGVLEAAFTVWNGTTAVADYVRPRGAAEDPGVHDAMRRTVCPSVG